MFFVCIHALHLLITHTPSKVHFREQRWLEQMVQEKIAAASLRAANAIHVERKNCTVFVWKCEEE